MTTVKVKFTAIQLGEICHKLNIVTSEPDLQASYKINQEEADEIESLFRSAKPGVAVEFDMKFADLLVGELEDVCLMWANRNEDYPNTDDLSMVSSMSNAIRKTKAAIIKATQP